MNEIEKLRILLPHWLEHNREHSAEFERWARSAQALGQTHSAQEIAAAAQCLAEANEHLSNALRALGGPFSEAAQPRSP